MPFLNNIAYLTNNILRHNEDLKAAYLFSIKRNLYKKKIDEDTIKKIISQYELTFCNHFVEISHLINFISTNRLAKNQKDDFFHNLFIYIKQFYSDFEFLKDIDDESDLIAFFNICYEIVDNFLYQFLNDYNIEYLNGNNELLNKITKFYSIITDFIIRFYGYSIIGLSNQQYIITSCNNCDKKFIDYLMQGYSLFRLQKIQLVNNPEDIAKQYYKFYPVLPTKDVGFPIDEYIEISDSDNENKIENKKLVKLLNLK